jgi:hypothetical protein
LFRRERKFGKGGGCLSRVAGHIPRAGGRDCRGAEMMALLNSLSTSRCSADISYICSCCGDRVTFEQWFELRAKKPLTFQAFVPQPPGLDVAAEDRWRIVHWNTTRKPSYEGENGRFMNRHLKITANRLTYRFASAYGPPLAVIRAMWEEHPDLEFTFRFRATWSGEAGEFVRPAGGGELTERANK